MNNISESYSEALTLLRAAFDAADQAHAALKSAGLLEYAATRYGSTVKGTVGDLEAMIRELEEARCADCDKLIREHADLSCQA